MVEDFSYELKSRWYLLITYLLEVYGDQLTAFYGGAMTLISARERGYPKWMSLRIGGTSRI